MPPGDALFIASSVRQRLAALMLQLISWSNVISVSPPEYAEMLAWLFVCFEVGTCPDFEWRSASSELSADQDKGC